MAEHEPTATTFRFTIPEFEKGRKVIRLARTDRMVAALQVVKQGGENLLHSHKHLDGFWMVLKGRARFYGPDNVVIGDLGAREGILIPRGFRYWFESASEEVLELLQVEASDIAVPLPTTGEMDKVTSFDKQVYGERDRSYVPAEQLTAVLKQSG